ncbi:MAG: AAA family ATPase [Gammaproteobacteria bacterium]
MPINLLVGPNGTGKSNIVDALRFIKDAITHGLDYAIHERHGIDIVRQHSPRRPYRISLKVEFDYLLTNKKLSAFYNIKIESKKGSYKVFEEEAQWHGFLTRLDEKRNREEYSESKIHLLRNEQGKVIINNNELELTFPDEQLFFTRPLNRGIFTINKGTLFLDFMPFSQSLTKLRFASIYPNVLRQPARPDIDDSLKEGCSNWASVIKTMRQSKAGGQALQRILELMEKIIPGIQQVTVKNVGGYLVPQFLVKDKPNAAPHYLDPVQLSDGTLRMFGLLLSLYQQPPPSFLALEEPEQTIHPGLLGLLAEAFREASKSTQLLITTHSPYLLDYFQPEEIHVVTVDAGETRVAPMRRSQVHTVKNNLMTMSEVMALDGLQPELSP